MSDDIEALLKASIQTKVIEALNSTPDMIEKLVEAAFHKPVNEHGEKPDRGGWGNETKMPYLEWLIGNEIRNAACSIVREYVADHQETIRKKIHEAIEGGDFASPIIKFFDKSMQDDFRWTFDMNLIKDPTD
ncbi:MAG: hypothetical protein GY941_28605 [Planctomycetes bacterium]|nr:hypothetical protein [Planctomycetota bacterium]